MFSILYFKDVMICILFQSTLGHHCLYDVHIAQYLGFCVGFVANGLSFKSVLVIVFGFNLC